MKPFRINNSDKSDTLIKFASANGLDINDVLAMYLVIGDDLFFLMSVFSGKTIKVPFHKRLEEVGNNDSIRIVECEEDDYVCGELIEIGKKLYRVTKEPQKILAHYYCIVEECND